MKTVVIHHSADFDGIFCREIARKFLPEAELIGWDYGDPIPSIPAGCELYMLDISVDGLMEYPNLIWIDHHKSAMEKFGVKAGYQIDGVAACRLAWQWFTTVANSIPKGILMPKQDFVDRRVSEPWSVRLAGEYDIWDKRDLDAELFQHGLRSRDLSESDWSSLLSYDRKCTIAELEALIDVGHQDILAPDGTCRNPTVLGLLSGGKVVQYSKTKENESIIRSTGFDLEFEGLRFLACNATRYNSHLFSAGLRDDHDACFGFNWDGPNKSWKISLYHAPGKEHHDLSLIAVKHGGGGHRGACGFRMKEASFLP